MDSSKRSLPDRYNDSYNTKSLRILKSIKQSQQSLLESARQSELEMSTKGEDKFKRKEKEQKEKMKWFIKGDGLFRFWWDMAIIVFTTYSVWQIPMKLAFDSE